MVKFNILLLYTFLLFAGLIGCKQENDQKCIIHINIKAPSEGIINLVKIGLNDGNEQVVDSSGNGIFSSFSFSVAKDPSSFYQVKIPLFSNSIYIIPDTKEISIQANLANKKSTVNGSVVNNVLYTFYKTLKELNTTVSPEKGGVLKGINRATSSYTLSFIDTVSNPALFMVAYNTIEFNNDFKLLKEVVDKASKRFPAVNYIGQLKMDVYRMIDVYEKEYNVGDVLPAIALENNYSNTFSTATLKGKYYFINFWSTWCDHCFPYMESIKKQASNIDNTKLAFVSTAIDDNKDDWKKIIQQQGYNWTHIIDEKMWKGEAVNTLKFDSIPFNFLVSPEGKVLAKAIHPDSLQYYLGKYNLLKNN